LEECTDLESELNIGENLRNIDLIEAITKSPRATQKRKNRKLIASVLGQNPYKLDFDQLAEQIRDSTEDSTDSSSDSDSSEPNIDTDNVGGTNTPRKKVTFKQIVSYIVNFIASFGTGSGFVYWGAFMFGVATPFGWALILTGVIVGAIVGGIFVAQQIRMEHMHRPIDESANNMRDSLKLRRKLLKRYAKSLEMKEANVASAEQVEKVEPNVECIPAERQHLYKSEVPDDRKHSYRAGAISYNAVLGFVIGFGLVLTFAFVTGGVGLIPGIIIGAAFSGYFIYAGADGALSDEEKEVEKRSELHQAQVDFETHWKYHKTDGFNPVTQLKKSVPLLAFNLIENFHANEIHNIGKKRLRDVNKVLSMLQAITSIKLRRKKRRTEASFDELYAYFLINLKAEMEEDDNLTPEVIKQAVFLLKQKVMGKNVEGKNILEIKEPVLPETLIEKAIDWVKENTTDKNLPKTINRIFAIIGILTLGAAIPFMAMTGGIGLPIALGVFMVALLTAYVVREVMQYKREQDLLAIDQEILKYEAIECTRKVLKPQKGVVVQHTSLNKDDDERLTIVKTNELTPKLGLQPDEKVEMFEKLRFLGACKEPIPVAQEPVTNLTVLSP